MGKKKFQNKSLKKKNQAAGNLGSDVSSNADQGSLSSGVSNDLSSNVSTGKKRKKRK